MNTELDRSSCRMLRLPHATNTCHFGGGLDNLRGFQSIAGLLGGANQRAATEGRASTIVFKDAIFQHHDFATLQAVFGRRGGERRTGIVLIRNADKA